MFFFFFFGRSAQGGAVRNFALLKNHDFPSEWENIVEDSDRRSSELALQQLR